MPKISNRVRILQTSRDLMNQSGAQSISTNHICEALKISPGNLYYHFKNKEEIVYALFLSFKTEFVGAFADEPEKPVSPEDFAGYYIRTLDIAFDYRFLFSGLLALLRRDDQLAAEYRALQTWTLARLSAIAAQVAEDGNLGGPGTPTQYDSIALNTWLIWSNWVRHIEISKGSSDVSRSDMVQGLHQIFDVLSGQLAPQFEAAVRAHLNQAE